MKKYLSFGIGLILALPISILAYVEALPDFPDVKRNISYASDVYMARDTGWMTGDKDGKFRPKKSVKRAELATALANYDRNMKKVYEQLKSILCLNKGNSLNELGLKVVNEDRYAEALSGFCGGVWASDPVDCYTPYDAQTGEYQVDFIACP